MPIPNGNLNDLLSRTDPAGPKGGCLDENDEAKLAAIRAAIDEGDVGEVAEGDVFGRVREALRLSLRPR